MNLTKNLNLAIKTFFRKIEIEIKIDSNMIVKIKH